MPRYWLHRISNEYDVSYSLLMKGYLTLGWSNFADTTIMDDARKDVSEFEKICKKKECADKRSRWSMWYFAQFAKGDTVVVPLYDGKFMICKVTEQAKPIQAFTDDFEAGLKANINSGEIDLGFAAKVDFLTEEFMRSEYAEDALAARMKMRQTNGEITDRDIIDNIDKIIRGEKITPFCVSVKGCADEFLKPILDKLTPIQFEKLIQQYMQKLGADDAFIPAKNEPGKTDSADADVIAIFNALKIVVLIQAKHHKEITDKVAVNQIAKYTDQVKADGSKLLCDYSVKDYLKIPWAVTSADCFDKQAAEEANEKKVRLINRKEFAEMLLDAGIVNINI